MMRQTQGEQQIAEMIQEFGDNRNFRVTQTMNSTNTSSSMEHKLKHITFRGKHGVKNKDQIQLLEQIGASSNGISDC